MPSHPPKPLRSRLRRRELAVGVFIRGLRPHSLADVLPGLSVDMVVLDTEHEPWNDESLLIAVRHSAQFSQSVLVRVPDLSYQAVAKPVDYGADGVIVPRLESAQQATAVSNFARLPPRGTRGVAVRRAVLDSMPQEPLAARLQAINENTIVIVQIETAAGVENAAAIAATEGIDGVLVGLTDLSCSLGQPGERHAPAVRKAIGRIMAACAAVDKPMGIAGTEDECKEWQARGARLLFPGNDISLLRDAINRTAIAVASAEQGHAVRNPPIPPRIANKPW